MSSRLELTRNNVRAGVWVTVCLVLALGVVIALTDVLSAATRSYDEYSVRFTVRDGVGNLQPGSSVRVGGLDAGRVTDLEPLAGVDGAFEHIVVHFKLDSTFQLFTDAAVTVDGALIGSDAWLTISNLGTAGQVIPAGQSILGADAPGMLVSMLGPDIADDATQIVDDVTGFSAFLKGFPDHYDEDFKPIVLDVKDFSARFDGWGDRVDHVMTWSNEVTGDIDRAIATGQAVLDDGRDMMEHNRPQIDEIIDNVEVTSGHVRSVAQEFDEVTMAKVTGFLDTGNDALEKANDVITALRADYDRWAVDLGETFANASLTAQQLKLVMGDIGRNPWKVLYRPTTDELENELLFEAARSFALAAADLKASAATVDRVMTNHGDRLGANQAALERLQNGLTTSLENYEKAQKQLYEVLVQE